MGLLSLAPCFPGASGVLREGPSFMGREVQGRQECRMNAVTWPRAKLQGDKTASYCRNMSSCEVTLREAKPGGFQTGGFPIFSGKVRIVSRTLSGLFLLGAANRPRKRKRTSRENPRRVPEQIRKILEK